MKASLSVGIFATAAISIFGIAFGATAAPGASTSSSPSGNVCSALDRSIDADELEISDETAIEMAEDSAPRASVEEMKINAAYQSIQANIALMGQHHCAPYNHAIGPSYLADAIQCHTDILKSAVSGSATTPDSCDRTKWKRLD